ncbi:hypothetical protein [Enterobacter asburiae]|uniref:hypothetical protein n=1 Tax=Enterobacter asburiae TaxID=61645 RepID=UPI0015E9B961|nr:hypothetical protein [Enterobacter asburiae]QLY66794.1 hypothetical protein HV228_19820 [Enterobacter asburiae]
MNLTKSIFTKLVLLTAISTPVLSQAQEKPAFTPEQQAQIGKITEEYFTAHPEQIGEAISVYLATHPEFFVAASDTLRQNQQAAAKKVQEMQQAAQAKSK